MRILQSFVLACCVVVAFGAAGTACGGSDEPATDTPPPPPPPPPTPGACDAIDNSDEMPACFQTALCEKLLSCGFGNVGNNSCDDVVPGFFFFGGYSYQEVADVQVAIEAGRTEFDTDAASACVNAITDATCLELVSGGGGIEAACDSILVGLGTATDPCSNDSECASEFFCHESKSGPGTTCEPLGQCAVRAADGAACGAIPCRDGSSCVNGTCETGATGAPCYYNDHCDNGLACVTVTAVGGGVGTCQPIDSAAEGDVCDNPGDLCAGPQAFICIPATPDALTGTCEYPDTAGATCIQFCGGGLACVHEPDVQLGTCTALSGFADVGDVCDDASPRVINSPCGLYLTCQPGATPDDPATCQNPGNEGEPCGMVVPLMSGGSGFGECNLGLFCSNEIVDSPAPVCVKAGGDGAFCSYDAHCAVGTCGASGRCGEPTACEGAV